MKGVSEMDESRNNKIQRVLGIYAKLARGQLINKSQEAALYGVNDRSIQRDLDDIREFTEINDNVTVVYDYSKKGYRLEQLPRDHLSKGEILAICKILLDSKAFTKKEMSHALDRLVECCAEADDREQIKELIQNEAYHYVEPRHKTEVIDTMWEIGQAIRECRYIEVNYLRTKDKSVVTRKLKPLAIMFSEYYFYLTAFIDDREVRENFDVINDSFPTIYRIDRIKKLTVLNDHFYTPYRDRFEEGEFRKRVQFMYGGKLQKIKFQYSGPDVDAVLDRLPTAVILDEQDGVFTISAEVFGKGIAMWIRSQGDYISLL